MAITERWEAIEALVRCGAKATAALEWVCPQISDAVLRQIAECDYGFDADLNFECLVQIRDTRQVPRPMEWNPKEVLELTRNSRDKNLTRYFACAALVAASATDPEFEDVGGDSTAILLVESAMEHGLESCLAAFRSLSAFLVLDPDDADDFPITSCVAMLAVACCDALHDRTLIPFLIDSAKSGARDLGISDDKGLRFVDLADASTWRSVAQRLLVPLPARGSGDARLSEGRIGQPEDDDIYRWINAEILAFRRAFE